ncbi:MAG TPA: hypothetical protein VFQ35_25370 [Polyangiaceae bacterium]|nr:hypothetical protein [Polyangiaceae bacterium]
MSREVPLVRGGVGHIESADAQHVVVDIGVPSPPGSTVELLVANAPLGVKVRSCRRLPDVEPTRFRVEGRWISLSRVQREALGIEL